MFRTSSHLWIAAVAAILLLASPVSAQEDRARATRLFQQGNAALEGQRFEEAIRLYTEALVHYPGSLRILMNLGVAQRGAGRLLLSAETFRRWLAAENGRDPDFRIDVERQLREVLEATPRLTIRLIGMLDSDVFTVDDLPVPPPVVDEPLRVDPGRHSLAIVRDGRIITRAYVELGPSGRGSLELVAPARLADAGSGRFESPWPSLHRWTLGGNRTG